MGYGLVFYVYTICEDILCLTVLLLSLRPSSESSIMSPLLSRLSKGDGVTQTVTTIRDGKLDTGELSTQETQCVYDARFVLH